MMLEIDKRRIRVWSMLGMSRTFGSVLEDMLCEDDRLVLSVADVGRIIAYNSFERNYPNHVFEMGIAEQNLITASAGLAHEGYNVFASSYSTFLTARALDQVRVNMGMMKLPIKLIGIGGGLADGTLSATHMGIEDVSNMRCIPGMTVIVPSDGLELVKVLFALLKYDKPAYVKLTGESSLPVIYREDFDYQIGKAITLCECEGDMDVAIISCGAILSRVMKAREILAADGIKCKVIDMHTIAPIDEQMLESLKSAKMIVTVEEHSVRGGLGSAIAEWYSDKKKRPVQLIIGVTGDSYPDASEYDNLLTKCRLDENSIAGKIKERFLSL